MTVVGALRAWLPGRPLEDIGGFGGARESRKRCADMDFLEKVRAASAEELAQMMRAHRSSSTPEWKRVAIRRALVRRVQG